MKISRGGFWWLLTALVVAFISFALLDHHRRQQRAVLAATTASEPGTGGNFEVDVAAMDCPTPFADQSPVAQPLQGDGEGLPNAFALSQGAATPIAPFAVEGRVLGRKNYDSDRESRFAPTDIAFGWGRMRDPSVIDRLHITQSSRWYHYNWTGEPPLPVAEIVRSSANMHMIPANTRIADALSDVARNDIVRVDGFLVTVTDGKGWGWHSSTTREDSGAGACEVVYVCRVRIKSI